MGTIVQVTCLLSLLHPYLERPITFQWPMIDSFYSILTITKRYLVSLYGPVVRV